MNIKRLLMPMEQKLERINGYPLRKVIRMQETKNVLKSPLCLLFQANSPANRDFEQLRLQLSEKKLMLKCIKTSFLNLCIRNTSLKHLESSLKGPLVLGTSSGEPAEIRPALELLKDQPHLLFLGGIYEEQVFDDLEFTKIARRSRKELIQELCGLLTAPTRTLVSILENPVASLIGILPQVAEKKASAVEANK